MGGAFLRTRVAQRLFVLFVACAFVPLAIIAVLSLTQVRALLLQQADQRLAATAKDYAMTLFERMLLAADVGASAAAHPDTGAAPDGLPARTFRWLAMVDLDARVSSVVGRPEVPEYPPDVNARIATGKPTAVVTGSGEAVRIHLVMPLAGPTGGHMVGELRPGFLWGPADELPTATEFCIVEEVSRRLLHCSARMGEGAVRVLGGAKPGGTATWRRGDETLRTRTWAQFMRAGFGTEDWVVVASQPESHVLSRMLEFRNLYVPVVALTLLLVIWLTLRHSRHIVAPVTQLAERARAISANDFDTRLDLKRDDEFGELAGAFDHMSQRLGEQFASLTALSEIDRLILSTQDTAQIIRAVLARLREVVAADVITITLFEHDTPDNARTYSVTREAPEGGSMVRHTVTAGDRAMLGAESASRWVSLTEARHAPAFLGPAKAMGILSAYVQPIVWRAEPCGAIVLGYRSELTTTDEERSRARELADRVAVAVSSAWRDEQLYAQAHFDPLTGAPNRLLFKDRLELEIVRSQREGLTFALLFVDLDHFKNVNDSFGHTLGDTVLREAAQRIQRCTRASDTVARLGGDEFTVLVTNLNHAQEAWLVAESVVAALSQEFILGGQQCFLSASVGIASFPADGSSAEELLKCADTAMYRAKANGRSQAVFFEERMNAEAVARLTLDRDLRAAIDRGEITLHYQPQLDLRTGVVRSAEALVRWKHPTRGMVSPVRFIPLAEESGFIETLGQWIVEQACAQARAWREQGIMLEHVSVNVSPRQFRKRGIVDFIERCTREAGLPASCLQIEITEGLLLDRGEAVEGMLRELARNGHEIALDDFGTGFSSMAYLKRLPVHTIKIDRVFVEGLTGTAESEPIVAAIIAMSHALGKTVIAEGVETPEQLAILRRLRCDEVQGFLVAPALEPAEFQRLLTSRAASPASAAA